jgi:hypothetical protein
VEGEVCHTIVIGRETLWYDILKEEEVDFVRTIVRKYPTTMAAPIRPTRESTTTVGRTTNNPPTR